LNGDCPFPSARFGVAILLWYLVTEEARSTMTIPSSPRRGPRRPQPDVPDGYDNTQRPAGECRDPDTRTPGPRPLTPQTAATGSRTPTGRPVFRWTSVPRSRDHPDLVVLLLVRPISSTIASLALRNNG
jgi:hypothetical protein